MNVVWIAALLVPWERNVHRAAGEDFLPDKEAIQS